MFDARQPKDAAARRPGRPAGQNAARGLHFATEVRVRFAETDAQGIAHNAAYLVWFEVARIDYLARFRGRLHGAAQREASKR